ncbi:MAG: EAL domain-containing protein [Lachnospiraceae bacterium]|nr:EAL domain-containing protein [Lachnospiraceae bacterium]
MRIFVNVLSIAVLIIIGYCIFMSYRKKHRLSKVVGRILIVGWAIVGFDMLTHVVTSENLWMFLRTGRLILSSWMMFFLFRFSIEYVEMRIKRPVIKWIMAGVMIADSVSAVANFFTKHLFWVQKTVLFDGEAYFEMEMGEFLYTHHMILLVMAAICILSLLYKGFTAPKFYRQKYMLIAAMTLAIVVAGFLSIPVPIDISLFGYAFDAICIYYCALVYTPQKLLPQTLMSVADGMSVGLLMYDADGNKLYVNRYAKDLLQEDRKIISGLGHTFEEWCHKRYMNPEIEWSNEQVFYSGDEEIHFEISLHRLEDSRKHLQGGYYLIQNRTEEVKKLRLERYFATHDSLTGLYNKEYFCEICDKYIKNHLDEDLYMVCTDIKDFKMINDFLGTKTGDMVLANFAKKLKESLPKAVAVGRWSNDVFSVLIPKAEYQEVLFGEETRAFFFEDTDNNVLFPIVNYVGIFEVTGGAVPASVMCDRARMAITTVKGDYNKRVAYYDDKLRENIRREQELVGYLHDALRDGQITVHLQPQTTADGKVIGAEALVRWFHPEKGTISPSEFVPLFEKNGLITDVDRYIWELACKLLRKWKDEGHDDMYISVNVSPRDLYFINIYKVLTDLVEKYEIDPKNLKLEITETAIVLDFKRQMELIKRLRRDGFIVEMDDFGSGYSSLNLLKDLHVDILKIDMVFLKKAEDEERSKKILQMIISLSKNLGMPVITEGVENEEQLKYLSEMGCDMFQGYYFAKPMDIETFEKTYLN